MEEEPKEVPWWRWEPASQVPTTKARGTSKKFKHSKGTWMRVMAVPFLFLVPFAIMSASISMTYTVLAVGVMVLYLPFFFLIGHLYQKRLTIQEPSPTGEAAKDALSLPDKLILSMVPFEDPRGEPPSFGSKLTTGEYIVKNPDGTWKVEQDDEPFYADDDPFRK